MITQETISKLRDFIRNSESKMIELETLLTSIPALAPENGGQGELKKAKALIEWLIKNGIQKDAIECIETPDSRVESKIRPNIIVTIPGEDDSFSFWSMAHLDVVPVGESSLWHSDPWKVIQKDGKLYGRGTEDNQQGLVSSVFAALAYVKNNIKPAHTIKLLFIADEEVGSKYGIGWLLENKNLFKKEDVIIIPDGGDAKGETIEVAEKNLLWLKVHVEGKQSHGSRPDQGNNACLAANDLSIRLHKLQNIFNKKDSLFEPDYSTFHPTMRLQNVSGVNIIPGDETFFMDCRILPCYTLEEVLLKINETCSEIEKEYKVKVSFETPQKVQSPATPVTAPVVTRLISALKKAHGIKARTIGIGGGTVGAELRQKGFNAAVWSTLDECAHMPDEYCIIENMIKDSETMAVLFSEE